MNKHIGASMAILSLLIGACGAQPTEPVVSAEDIQITAMAAAFTIVAETQAAIPTNTQVPPTETLIPTPLPTDTPIPSPTIDPLLPTETLALSLTPQSEASTDPCNQPLTSWQGDSAKLSIAYNYKPQGKDDNVIVSLWVMTDLGECGYLYDLSTGPIGQYSAAAYIDGAKDFKVFGGFRISPGSWKLVISNDSIVAQSGCYPNC
jgi:hypothetical protein